MEHYQIHIIIIIISVTLLVTNVHAAARNLILLLVISQLPNLCIGNRRIYNFVLFLTGANSFGCILLARCYLPRNSRKIRCSFSLFFVKNAEIVQL